MKHRETLLPGVPEQILGVGIRPLYARKNGAHTLRPDINVSYILPASLFPEKVAPSDREYIDDIRS